MWLAVRIVENEAWQVMIWLLALLRAAGRVMGPHRSVQAWVTTVRDGIRSLKHQTIAEMGPAPSN